MNENDNPEEAPNIRPHRSTEAIDRTSGKYKLVMDSYSNPWKLRRSLHSSGLWFVGKNVHFPIIRKKKSFSTTQMRRL